MENNYTPNNTYMQNSYMNRDADNKQQNASQAFRASIPERATSDQAARPNTRPVYSTPVTPPVQNSKKNGVLKKILVGMAVGLAFGVFAAAGFYWVNTLTGKVPTQVVGTSNSTEIEDLKKQIETLQGTVSSINDQGVVVTHTTGDSTYSTIVTDVTEVVDKCMPSMVSITNLFEETYNYWGRRYVAENQASGSGIIVGENDNEFLLVTNYHVIQDNVQLTVKFVDETEAAAYVKGYDESIDIAVISVKKSDLSQATINAIKVAELGDSNTLRIGEPAIAIGNALGYGQSVTTGVISALNRDIEMENTSSSLIQTNAAINPGNSGGALLNIKGEVIGINSNKLGGTTIEGMGYAIPISDVRDIIETFMKREVQQVLSEDERGYLGIKGATVDDATRATFGIPEGVYVKSVYDRSAAEQAGIIKGDVITKIDGQSVKTLDAMQDILSYYKGGDTITITIMRAGADGYEEINIDVTLGTKSSVEG